jgi:hypothetical protein
MVPSLRSKTTIRDCNLSDEPGHGATCCPADHAGVSERYSAELCIQSGCLETSGAVFARPC